MIYSDYSDYIMISSDYIICPILEVSENAGYPMVYVMENPNLEWMRTGGSPNPHIGACSHFLKWPINF